MTLIGPLIHIILSIICVDSPILASLRSSDALGLLFEHIFRYLEVDRDVRWCQLDMLSQQALQTYQILLVDHLRCDQKRAFLVSQHIYGVNHIAHLTILEPFSIPDFHHNVLPGRPQLRLLLRLLLLLTLKFLFTGFARGCIFAVSGSTGSWALSARTTAQVFGVGFLVCTAAANLFVDYGGLDRHWLGTFGRLRHALWNGCFLRACIFTGSRRGSRLGCLELEGFQRK